MSDYKVGVEIALASNATQVFGALGQNFLQLERMAGSFRNNFAKTATIIGGALSIMAGVGVIKGLTDIAKHGEKLLDQQNKMLNAGRSQAEVTNLTADAFERITKSVPTAAAADVLRMTNELTQVLGSFEKARAEVTEGLKLEAMIGNVTGKSGEGQAQAVYRAMEEKLITQDIPHMHKIRELLYKGIYASGGKVTGTDVQTYARRAGASWIKASDEFIKDYLPTLIQSIGAATAGTAVQTLYMSMMGTATMSKQQLAAYRTAHMIDESKVSTDLGGRINMQPGAIVGSQDPRYVGNPILWSREVLGPHIDQFVPEKDREQTAAIMGRNRNTQRMIETAVNPLGQAQFDRDAALREKVLPMDEGYENSISKNPKIVIEAYNKQLDSMLSAMGGPLMQAAIPVMKQMTDAFNSMAAFSNANPGAIKAIGYGLAGLTAFLIGGGTVAILAALGPGGWIVGGIAALGVAIAGLSQVDWKAIGPSILDALRAAVSFVVGGIPGIFVQLGAAILSAIKNAIPSFGGANTGNPSGPGEGDKTPSLGSPMRWTPPPRSGSPVVIHTALHVDGRKLANAVTTHQVAMLGGPTEGSVYHDGTSGLLRNDSFRDG